MPVLAGLAVGIGLVALFITFMPISQNANNDYGLYLYLFKLNPSLEDHPVLAYSPPLYEKVSQITGIEHPTFEQMHYTISKEGVYNWTDRKIESYGFAVKIIVSDSIINPTNGSPLRENDISPTTRFYYAPMSPTTLILGENGEVFVLTQDYANDPDNHVDSSRTVKVLILPVETKDFAKVKSHYWEIRNLVESFDPSNISIPENTGSIMTAPKVSEEQAVNIVGDRLQEKMAGFKDFSIYVSSKGYMFYGDLKAEGASVPLVFVHQNGTMFFVNGATKEIIRSCANTEEQVCGYSASFVNETKGKLVYVLDISISSTKDGCSLPDIFIVNAVDGEIVFSFIDEQPDSLPKQCILV